MRVRRIRRNKSRKYARRSNFVRKPAALAIRATS